MTKKIFKYKLDRDLAIQTIELPFDAKILTIQTQDESPCIWAEVYEKNSLQERTFEIFGTGHDIDYDMGVDRKYIGTYQLNGGALVFHAFERIN